MRASGLVAAAAAVALMAGGVTEARSALRGLAVAHGSEHYEGDGDGDSGARFTPAHDESDKWEWKELSAVTGADAEETTTRDVKTPGDHDEADHEEEEASEIHEEDPDFAPSDVAHDADMDGDVDGSADTEDAEEESASSSKSFDFEAIAGEAQSDGVAGVVPADSDARGVSGGYSSGGVAQKVGTPAPSVAAVPIGESAAAAKPISEISASAIQKDPEAYGVVTPAPSVAAVPIGESAAAAKPISEISPAAIQKDPVGYGVVTPAPSTLKPVPIGESAAAAKPISDIDPSAIQRDPKSYGVATPVPGTTTMKLADSPMAASKPTADKSPTQKAF